MPLDSRIPLMGKPEDYSLDYKEPLQIMHLKQQGLMNRQNMLLNQEHMNAYRLQNEERQHDLDAEKEWANQVTANTKTGDDGTPHLDLQGAMQGMASKGMPNHGLKFANAYRAAEAVKIKNDADALKNYQESVKVASGALGPVLTADPKATPAQIESLYQGSRTTIGAQKFNGQPLVPEGVLPPTLLNPDGTINNDAMSAVKAAANRGLDLSKQVDDNRQAMVAASQIAENKAKTAKEKSTYLNQLASAAKDTAGLEHAVQFAKNFGYTDDEIKAVIPHGEDGKVLPWSQETVDQMAEATMTADQRAKAVDARKRAAETEARDKATQKHQDVMAKIAQQNADTRAKGGTQQARRTQISRLADQAIAESAQGGGGSIDDAIANVQTPSFYVNHPIGDNRGEVLKELESRKTTGLQQQHLQNQVDESGSGIRFDPTTGKLVRGGKGGAQPKPSAAAPKPTATPAPAPAPAPPPAPAPAGTLGAIAGPPAATAAPAATPAAQTFTEADVRKRAIAKGKDPDAAVKAARAAKLIQ